MNRHKKTEAEANFWPVYSDIAWVVVIIMLLFVLSLYLITAINLGGSNLEMQEKQQELKSEFTATAPDGQHPFVKGIVDIQEDGNLQLFIFDADHFFNFGKWTFANPESREFLKTFGEKLAKNIDRLTRIQIEGHASWERESEQAKGKKYEHENWVLSAERALAVGEMFIEGGVPAERVSVSGRSHYVPFDAALTVALANPGDIEKAAPNRRVNVIIFYSQVGKDSKILR